MPDCVDSWSVSGGGCSASGHVWDPVFASSPVETLKMTGTDVVRRIRAVRGGWSGPDVAGTSAVVDLGAASDRAVECLAWDGGGRHDMVDDWPIYELTNDELYMLFPEDQLPPEWLFIVGHQHIPGAEHSTPVDQTL